MAGPAGGIGAPRMIVSAIVTHRSQMKGRGPTIEPRPATSFVTWSSDRRQNEHFRLRILTTLTSLRGSFLFYRTSATLAIPIGVPAMVRRMK